jgi:hypothetical protein
MCLYIREYLKFNQQSLLSTKTNTLCICTVYLPQNVNPLQTEVKVCKDRNFRILPAQAEGHLDRPSPLPEI